MSDLIDRQKAIDALGEAPKFKIGLLKKYAEGRNDQWFDDVAALVKLPSAEPEITRCKDCKYRDVFGYCVYGTRLAWVTESNDFCSKAERRTDETD